MGRKNNNNESPGKDPVAKKDNGGTMTLKFRKPLANSKSTSSPTKQKTDGNKVSVFIRLCKSGDFLITVTKQNGEPCYMIPIKSAQQNDGSFFRSHLRINQVFKRRDPNDLNRHQEITNFRSGYNEHHTEFVGMLEPHEVEAFTGEKRMKCVEAFVHYMNHPDTKSMYKYPLVAEAGGDLTPQNLDNAPYLSDFLTLDDTMKAMRESMSDKTGFFASIGECLENTEAMNSYFGPNAVEEAKERFRDHRNHVPGSAGSGQSQEEPEEKYKGFQGFSI